MICKSMGLSREIKKHISLGFFVSYLLTHLIPKELYVYSTICLHVVCDPDGVECGLWNVAAYKHMTSLRSDRL